MVVPEGLVVAGLQGCTEAEDAFGSGLGPVAHAGLFAACADQRFAASLDLSTADAQS
jgi:hypothetical protein